MPHEEGENENSLETKNMGDSRELQVLQAPVETAEDEKKEDLKTHVTFDHVKVPHSEEQSISATASVGDQSSATAGTSMKSVMRDGKFSNSARKDKPDKAGTMFPDSGDRGARSNHNWWPWTLLPCCGPR